MKQGTGEFGDARTDKRLAIRRGAKSERMAGIGKDRKNTKRRKHKKKKTQKEENTKRRKHKRAVCLAQTALLRTFIF